jgi:hypothetical protein
MELSVGTKLRVRDHHLRLAQPLDGVRHRALARLYERRAAVDNLIGALERYQREQAQLRETASVFTAAEKSS